MVDFHKIFDVTRIESYEDECENSGKIKRVNANIDQDYSKHYVRLAFKIPKMKTSFNWRKLSREAKNGLIVKATYHGTRVYFEFLLNQGKSTEILYEYSSREPFRGPIEYNRSYLKFKHNYVIWFVHKSQPW